MYEVAGLFVLLLVGVVPAGAAGPAAYRAAEAVAQGDAPAMEAAHDLQTRVFGQDLVPISNTAFYVSVLVPFAVAFP